MCLGLVLGGCGDDQESTFAADGGADDSGVDTGEGQAGTRGGGTAGTDATAGTRGGGTAGTDATAGTSGGSAGTDAAAGTSGGSAGTGGGEGVDGWYCTMVNDACSCVQAAGQNRFDRTLPANGCCFEIYAGDVRSACQCWPADAPTCDLVDSMPEGYVAVDTCPQPK
mgnify:CR=1 FL=1